MTSAAGQGDRPVVVALVEDHALLSAALAAALRAEGLIVRLPEAATAATLDAVAAELRADPPDVALLDLDLGDLGDGADLVGPLSEAGTRVVIVSATSERWAIGRCLELGAVGWVPKTAPIADLLGAVRIAAAGGSPIAARLAVELRDAWRERRRSDAAARAPFEALSRREREVLSLLMDGRSAERIAEASYVSTATVRTQIRSILAKLGVNSQLEAVAAARRAGFTVPQD